MEPVPATRTVPSGDDVPVAKAASQSVITRIGHCRPARSQASWNSAEMAGSDSFEAPAMPRTPERTLRESRPSRASARASPMWAAATEGGCEFGFAPPATP
jgi:hypothetical protein